MRRPPPHPCTYPLPRPCTSLHPANSHTPHPARTCTTFRLPFANPRLVPAAALAGNASLQANTYLADQAAFSTFYPNVRDKTMYPFLWTLQNTELTEDLADLLKSDLFSLLDIAFIIWYTLMALGGFLLIGVCLFFVRERRIVATTGYKSINDD